MKLNHLLYRCIITDKNGKVVKQTHWRKSRSFVLQYLQLLEGFFRATSLSIKDTGGALRSCPYPYSDLSYLFCVGAGDNDSNFGLVVGTGTTAPTNTDYALATQIAHGVGAGQLDYGAHNFTSAGVVGANVDLIVSRTYYNGSGASITVNEVGIYSRNYDSVNVLRYFCIVRDVITAITVANTQTLTVQYTLRTTV